jgi:hypothetical protein
MLKNDAWSEAAFEVRRKLAEPCSLAGPSEIGSSRRYVVRRERSNHIGECVVYAGLGHMGNGRKNLVMQERSNPRIPWHHIRDLVDATRVLFSTHYYQLTFLYRL